MSVKSLCLPVIIPCKEFDKDGIICYPLGKPNKEYENTYKELGYVKGLLKPRKTSKNL